MEAKKVEIIKEKELVKCIFKEPRCDYYNVREIEEEVIKELAGAKKIVFDLKGVEFIASAFIRLCLEAIRISGKENFKIVNACKFVSNILKLSRFNQFIKIS